MPEGRSAWEIAVPVPHGLVGFPESRGDLREIDLVIDTADGFYPVKCKKTGTPGIDDARHFKVLGKLGKPVLRGRSCVPATRPSRCRTGMSSAYQPATSDA